MAKRASDGWVENIKTLVYAGLIAVGIRTVAFEPLYSVRQHDPDLADR